jgi:hypothetical protein
MGEILEKGLAPPRKRVVRGTINVDVKK